MTENKEEQIREQIKNLITQLYSQREKKFIPGESKVHYSSGYIDDKEVNSMMESIFNGWLAEGKKTDEFEKEFAKYITSEDCVVSNSGSSSLHLAFSTLMSDMIKNPLKKGDEVITTALTFPTSLNSIIHNNLEPVLVDVDLKTGAMDPKKVEEVINPKTRALLVLHHLGNPCDMDKIMEIAKNHDLFVIEDCCDAHGATYKGKKVGSFGDMGCFSFYCAHQMTMGEGGATTTKNRNYSFIIRSLKATGKACYCAYNETNINGACRNRFNYMIDGVPHDHRFVYRTTGYKMRILDLQAAMGLEQLKKLPSFVEKRRENYDFFNMQLKKYDKYFDIIQPTPNSDPSWFCIPIIMKKDIPFKKNELTKFLEEHKIETRPFLGGNLLKQPAYKNYNFKSSSLENTNYIDENSFFFGCYQGIDEEIREFVVSVFDKFFRSLKDEK